MVKNPPAMQQTWVGPWVRKIPWRREQLPTLVFWPGEFHGQRSLASYSPWGQKELDMTERLSLHFTLFKRKLGRVALNKSLLGNNKSPRLW